MNLIPVATPPALISVSLSGAGVKTLVTTEIELLPGSVAAAADCLGPGQSFSTIVADILPHSESFDESPSILQRVEPVYPRSAFVRGHEDIIPVRTLVCRTGRVIDAYVPPAYLDADGEMPVARDPKLVEAALTAVRQYVFRPAIVSGQPIAFWIDIPISFHK
jgi:hypothetical protein